VATSLKNGVLTVSTAVQMLNNDPVNPLTAAPPGLSVSLSFADAANGGGAGVLAECDKFHASSRTLALSAFEDLDLFAGALLDLQGGPFQITKLKFVKLTLLASPAGSMVTLGAAAANPIANLAGQAGNGPAGGVFASTNLRTAGWPVAAGTKNLRITNNDGALGVAYVLELAGKA
jgi:hypothetical protein